ncbi:MAG: hypothetical protein Greene071436_232 [Parcubacteria group bacterium Greene0714_36]|nr:MAG: hypothetical protein Greene071436_232 [Parcubacteria group bacterium Greene0714_36]
MKGVLDARGLLLYLCAIASLALSIPAHAGGMEFVFVSEPQAIRAGETSAEVKIQAQDGAGNEKKTEETIDLIFSSTSSTGEFLNASGNPVSTVMARGTANRTFYYRDASPGTHTLTVSATGRISGQIWTAIQSITIPLSTGAGAPVTPAVSSATATPSPAAASGSVTATPIPPTIEARAGKDQTAVAGATVNFQGTAIGLLGVPIENARFWWNFGDGATAEGHDAAHVFRVPGIYLTGLHVSSGIYAASDYVAVTVIPNKVSISEVVGGDAGFTRLKNGSEMALDIGGWTIEDGQGKSFVLPPHTMIRGKSDVALPHAVTGFIGAPSLTVRFPDGSVSFSYPSEPVVPEQTGAPVPTLSAVALAVSQENRKKKNPMSSPRDTRPQRRR